MCCALQAAVFSLCSMGTCCCKSAEHIDKKRHPLLREVYDDSRPSKCPSNGSIQNIERRARLDAIRGPPVLIVDKLPVRMFTAVVVRVSCVSMCRRMAVMKVL